MRLALYAHFSARRTVAKHVLFYLEQLRSLDFKVCFISNSPLDPTAVLRLEDVCDRVLQRENMGLDFAMWQRAMQFYNLSEHQELLLANSSVVGPIRPLAPLWEKPDLDNCDFWGLTDNKEFSPHLQSYFLVFRASVLRSEAFSRFWRSVLPFSDKGQIIRSYEIGLTSWLEQNGFEWKALFSQHEVMERYRNELNNRGFITKSSARLLKLLSRPAKSHTLSTTLAFPDYLIDMGMPFLKLAVLKKAYARTDPASAFKLLESTCLPADALDELRTTMSPLQTEKRSVSLRTPVANLL